MNACHMLMPITGRIMQPKAIIQANTHLGHNINQMNNNMAPYILTAFQGIHLLDIYQSSQLTELLACMLFNQYKYLHACILGNKCQLEAIIRTLAVHNRYHHANGNWLTGALTNWNGSLMTWTGLMHTGLQSPTVFQQHTANNDIHICTGIMHIKKPADIVIGINQQQQKMPIDECLKVNIPTCCLVDSDCYPIKEALNIPANDDAHASINCILSSCFYAFN